MSSNTLDPRLLNSYYRRLVIKPASHAGPGRNWEMPKNELETALEQLGPLEARIMRLVWEARVVEPFVVRSVLRLLPDLAYTTVMTTLNRLAEKGLLEVRPVARQRAHQYRAAMDPATFLIWASRRDAERMVVRYGDLALAAFASRLDQLSASQRERLRRLIES